MTLTGLEWSDRHYAFASPLRLTSKREGKMTILSFAPLHLVGGGDNQEAALADFCENFAYLHQELTTTPDQELDGPAQSAKRWLEKNVTEMVPEHA